MMRHHDDFMICDFVNVPAGTFVQGSSADQIRRLLAEHSGVDPTLFVNEIGVRELELDAFRLARTPVTNRQFRAFVEERGYARPKFWSAAGWDWRARNGIVAPRFWGLAGW